VLESVGEEAVTGGDNLLVDLENVLDKLKAKAQEVSGSDLREVNEEIRRLERKRDSLEATASELVETPEGSEVCPHSYSVNDESDMREEVKRIDETVERLTSRREETREIRSQLENATDNLEDEKRRYVSALKNLRDVYQDYGAREGVEEIQKHLSGLNAIS